MADKPENLTPEEALQMQHEGRLPSAEIPAGIEVEPPIPEKPLSNSHPPAEAPSQLEVKPVAVLPETAAGAGEQIPGQPEGQVKLNQFLGNLENQTVGPDNAFELMEALKNQDSNPQQEEIK